MRITTLENIYSDTLYIPCFMYNIHVYTMILSLFVHCVRYAIFYYIIKYIYQLKMY